MGSREIPEGVDHHHDNQPPGQGNAEMGQGTAGELIHHDGSRPGKDHRVGTEEFGKKSARKSRHRRSEGFTTLETGCVGLKNKSDLIADTTELIEDLLLGSCCMGRVIKAPVEAFYLPGEHRAGLVGIAADGNHRIDVACQEPLEVLRDVAGDINPDLLQDFDGLGVDIARRFGARTGDFNEIACRSSEDSLGEVTAAGVSGAENEDKRLHGKCDGGRK